MLISINLICLENEIVEMFYPCAVEIYEISRSVTQFQIQVLFRLCARARALTHQLTRTTSRCMIGRSHSHFAI